MDHRDYVRFLGTLALTSRAEMTCIFHFRPEWQQMGDEGYCLDAPEMFPANTRGMGTREGSVVHRWLFRG